VNQGKHKFLFTVWPFSGHIHPNLAIAEELSQRGHQIAFYTGRKAQATVEKAGFEFFPLRKVDEARVEQLLLSPEGIIGLASKPVRLRRAWREWTIGTMPGQIEDVSAIIDEWSPDGIVCDPTMWGPFLVLYETKKIPVSVFSLIPACHVSGRDAPILGFPLPRARNSRQRMRATVLRRVSDFVLDGVRKEVSALRQSYGLAPLHCKVGDFAAQLQPYLVPSSPEFDYQRDDLPPSVHYVGPCLWKGGDSSVLPDWVRNLPHDQPWVYASEGTVHLEPRLLRAVAQGLANLPVQVIITTGKHRDPNTLDLGPRPLAPNIHVHQWVPQNALMPHLSALVTVGGPSTMMAAFDAGIPVVIVPYTWDHPESGFRVAESGAGLRIGHRECTPERMRNAVERVLHEPSFRENAARLAASFARYGGASKAAGLIAGMVRNSPERDLRKPAGAVQS
jgi:MGT family glycosyltransferase